MHNAPKCGRLPEQEIALLDRLCETMKFGSLCALGGFTPYPVMSALKNWPEDFMPAGAAEGPRTCGRLRARARNASRWRVIGLVILGVVLAGGQSTRFGSDKALAELGGHTLLARAFDTLTGSASWSSIAGRERGPGHCIPDWPRPNMGPLAGIAAGLHLARDEGYDSVLTLRRGLGRPARQPARIALARARPISTASRSSATGRREPLTRSKRCSWQRESIRCLRSPRRSAQRR